MLPQIKSNPSLFYYIIYNINTFDNNSILYLKIFNVDFGLFKTRFHQDIESIC